MTLTKFLTSYKIPSTWFLPLQSQRGWPLEGVLAGQGRSLSPCSANRNYLLAQIVLVAFVRRKIQYERYSPPISGKCYNEVKENRLPGKCWLCKTRKWWRQVRGSSQEADNFKLITIAEMSKRRRRKRKRRSRSACQLALSLTLLAVTTARQTLINGYLVQPTPPNTMWQ